jgi:hypothetical protein
MSSDETNEIGSLSAAPERILPTHGIRQEIVDVTRVQDYVDRDKTILQRTECPHVKNNPGK